ncbi:DUF1842 domain-containing protein [Massilia sp. YIM B04103]|uniref:DUF1842 domain-containing protein n=1 Tax=Massilia sp. YIM B04103 TaxID=2963106 RepID=UPI00210A6C10|nr:DUF1842 domain-containing protein [Massilia sp. YIM B04103]
MSENIFPVTQLVLTTGSRMRGEARLQLTLLHNPELGQTTVVGIGFITQATLAPAIEIPIVSGQVVPLEAPNAERVLRVEGSYVRDWPGTQPGQSQEHFYGTFLIDKQWNGRGTFSYGKHVVHDVLIERVIPDNTLQAAA